MIGTRMETLKALRHYFPTAVFTGKCLVFISENWRVELTEHHDNDYTGTQNEIPLIRVRIAKRALDGEVLNALHEDFQLPTLGEMADEIEKYVQMAIGSNLRETLD